MSVGILDIGLGNLESLRVCLQRGGFSAKTISKPTADLPNIVLLPGVGNFALGANNLDKLGFRVPIVNHVQNGGAIIGICLGMQLLGTSSDEGPGLGLKLLDFEVRKVHNHFGQRPPITGWKTPRLIDSGWLESQGNERYFFMHDFGVMNSGQSFIKMTHQLGDGLSLASGVQQGRIIGFQFHPERSLRFGTKILSNAVRLLDS